MRRGSYIGDKKNFDYALLPTRGNPVHVADTRIWTNI